MAFCKRDNIDIPPPAAPRPLDVGRGACVMSVAERTGIENRKENIYILTMAENEFILLNVLGLALTAALCIALTALYWRRILKRIRTKSHQERIVHLNSFLGSLSHNGCASAKL